MKQTGYIHIYCGDGKGKTTTGMGLCARAAGSGLKVLVYQFMKDNTTCERAVLEQIPGITFVDGLPQEKFSFQMTDSEKAQRRGYYESQFSLVTEKASREGYQVLFLDEIIYTIRAGLFSEELLLDWLGKNIHTIVLPMQNSKNRRSHTCEKSTVARSPNRRTGSGAI